MDGLNPAERLFVEAALLAPLSRGLRKSAFRYLRSERYSYCDKSRFTATWRQLIWPRHLLVPQRARIQQVQRALREQLSSDDIYAQERASYCVWLLHAIPELTLDPPELAELATLVLNRAQETQDHLLRRLAIHIWEVTNPIHLATRLEHFEGVRHLAFSDVFMRSPQVVEHSVSVLNRGIASLQNEAPVGELGRAQKLLQIWDLASGIASWVDPQKLAREPAFLIDNQCLLTMALARAGAEEAGERFASGARDRPHQRLTLAQAIEKTLKNRSKGPHPVLRRRLAAYLLRELGPDRHPTEGVPQSLDDAEVEVAAPSPHKEVQGKEGTIITLASHALEDDYPFVALSAVSSLRDCRCTASFSLLSRTLERSLYAHRRHQDTIHVTLGALFTLDPRRSEELCRKVAASKAGHRARGQAARYLSELWKGATGGDQVELFLRLLDLLPHREFALNLASALVASFPGGVPLARLLALRSPFRSPVPL